MTIDVLIEKSRNEGLWVDDDDKDYGFCQCKVSMTGDVVWIAEFDGKIWSVFQSFDTDTPMLSLETVECGTIAELVARLKSEPVAV